MDSCTPSLALKKFTFYYYYQIHNFLFYYYYYPIFNVGHEIVKLLVFNFKNSKTSNMN